MRRATVRRRRDGTPIDVEMFVMPLGLNVEPVGTDGLYRDLPQRLRTRNAAGAARG